MENIIESFIVKPINHSSDFINQVWPDIDYRDQKYLGFTRLDPQQIAVQEKRIQLVSLVQPVDEESELIDLLKNYKFKLCTSAPNYLLGLISKKYQEDKNWFDQLKMQYADIVAVEHDEKSIFKSDFFPNDEGSYMSFFFTGGDFGRNRWQVGFESVRTRYFWHQEPNKREYVLPEDI